MRNQLLFSDTNEGKMRSVLDVDCCQEFEK